MSNEIQFLLYSLPDEQGKVQVVIKDETIWCTQKTMAELFGIDKSGISRHIANIFKDEELQDRLSDSEFRILEEEILAWEKVHLENEVVALC